MCMKTRAGGGWGTAAVMAITNIHDKYKKEDPQQLERSMALHYIICSAGSSHIAVCVIKVVPDVSKTLLCRADCVAIDTRWCSNGI